MIFFLNTQQHQIYGSRNYFHDFFPKVSCLCQPEKLGKETQKISWTMNSEHFCSERFKKDCNKNKPSPYTYPYIPYQPMVQSFYGPEVRLPAQYSITKTASFSMPQLCSPSECFLLNSLLNSVQLLWSKQAAFFPNSMYCLEYCCKCSGLHIRAIT